MRDATGDFFAGLSLRARVTAPSAKAAGTVRIDLTESGDHVAHWYVLFDDGKVRVSRDEQPADLIITTDKALFDCLVTGEERVEPHVIGGRMELTGSGVGLYNNFRRLFPDPKGARDPRSLAPPTRRRGA